MIRHPLNKRFTSPVVLIQCFISVLRKYLYHVLVRTRLLVNYVQLATLTLLTIHVDVAL